MKFRGLQTSETLGRKAFGQAEKIEGNLGRSAQNNPAALHYFLSVFIPPPPFSSIAFIAVKSFFHPFFTMSSSPSPCPEFVMSTLPVPEAKTSDFPDIFVR